jgi:ferredoxin
LVSAGQLHVQADRDVCIGAGMCVLTAGAVFDQDDDGLVVVVDETPADEDAARQAVANCPSGALSVTAGVAQG